MLKLALLPFLLSASVSASNAICRLNLQILGDYEATKNAYKPAQVLSAQNVEILEALAEYGVTADRYISPRSLPTGSERMAPVWIKERRSRGASLYLVGLSLDATFFSVNEEGSNVTWQVDSDGELEIFAPSETVSGVSELQAALVAEEILAWNALVRSATLPRDQENYLAYLAHTLLPESILLSSIRTVSGFDDLFAGGDLESGIHDAVSPYLNAAAAAIRLRDTFAQAMKKAQDSSAPRHPVSLFYAAQYETMNARALKFMMEGIEKSVAYSRTIKRVVDIRHLRNRPTLVFGKHWLADYDEKLLPMLNIAVTSLVNPAL